jgi:crotonobetainyl-CoA:carnitine CoA-transferase CaiB-like acyl-CoA transferase
MRNAAFGDKTTAEWLDILDEAGLPSMPCHSLDSLMEDPHLTAAGLLDKRDHPTEGPIRTIRSIIITDGTMAGGDGIAPPLGWDTEAVLFETGFTAAEITAFTASGAIFGPAPA